MSPVPRIVSVNVSLPRAVEWRGRQVTTGIYKEPVDGPVRVEGVNIVGDDQADRRVHGGEHQAVYAYSVEDYAWWVDELADGAMSPGTFGENLTTEGIDLTSALVGDRWHIDDVVLEISQPRLPCYKLGIKMGDDDFPDRFTAAARLGAYLRIVHPGTIRPGDVIQVQPAAEPHIPVGMLARSDAPRDALEAAADDPRVPPGWRRTVARVLTDSETREPQA